ncbi:MAG: SDR family NAD(P)-dependent oxidoreductase, partial [Brevundimonas sp.]|nr:SDR family NAD(P)-dependent oxidoreductase [Brevundimonas sp.]
DILINNAALFDLAPIVEINRESFDRLFAINVAGTLFTLQAVAKSMIARGKGGKIINMASQAGRRGEALVARMDATLRRAAPGPATPGRSALYLTAGGFTAGQGTLVDSILKAAGFANAAPGPFFAPVSVERIALFPPTRFVLGFFDQPRGDWRGPGRHPVIQRAARDRVAARLPAAALTCPAWFAADAAAMLKAGT